MPVEKLQEKNLKTLCYKTIIKLQTVSNLNSPCEFGPGDPPSVEEHLPADVLAHGGGSVQHQRHVGQQSVLRPRHLHIVHIRAQAHPDFINIIIHNQ